MNPFTALTSKIFAGLTVALLIFTGWLLLTKQELKTALANEQASHSQTKANVAIASAQAQAAITGNLTRVASEQEKVNEERIASLRTRLANAERLRAESQAAARRAGQTSVPSVSATPERVATETEPAARNYVDLEALIRYDELISWVEQTHLIPTSPVE